MSSNFNLAQILAEVFQKDFKQIDTLAKQIEPDPQRRTALLKATWTEALQSYRTSTLHFSGSLPQHPIEILTDFLLYKAQQNKHTFHFKHSFNTFHY
jgi:hypothetical protein